MIRYFALTVALAVSACASMDRGYLGTHSEYVPSESGFTFTAPTSTNMQQDSDGAERQRLRVMSEFAARNGTCPKGYQITSRHWIARPKTAIGVGTLGTLVYSARCN